MRIAKGSGNCVIWSHTAGLQSLGGPYGATWLTNGWVVSGPDDTLQLSFFRLGDLTCSTQSPRPCNRGL